MTEAKGGSGVGRSDSAGVDPIVPVVTETEGVLMSPSLSGGYVDRLSCWLVPISGRNVCELPSVFGWGGGRCRRSLKGLVSDGRSNEVGLTCRGSSVGRPNE